MASNTSGRAFVEGTDVNNGADIEHAPVARPEGLNAPAPADPFGLRSFPSAGGGGACRVCGCVDAAACEGLDGLPCGWAEPGLCTTCAGLTVTQLAERAQRVEMMVKCADIAAAGEVVPGDEPAEWCVVARWPDGRVSVRGGPNTPALAAKRVLFHLLGDGVHNALKGWPGGSLSPEDARRRRVERGKALFEAAFAGGQCGDSWLAGLPPGDRACVEAWHEETA